MMHFSGEVVLDTNQVENSESELIGRARRDDPNAWQLLVSRYQEPVFRLAYLVLRDPDDAADVAQEAFIQAFLSLDRFDAERPFRPWLMRIAINRARNRRRSMGRYVANVRRLLEKSPRPTASVDATHQIVQGHRQADRMGQAVERLNSIGQEVIYLRYFLDLSEAEMAEALGVAPGTVKSRLHRALKKLRDIIAAEYPDLSEAFGQAPLQSKDRDSLVENGDAHE
jgi:RNA polymerase sigma-70 factor (ECF subfamily)